MLFSHSWLSFTHQDMLIDITSQNTLVLCIMRWSHYDLLSENMAKPLATNSHMYQEIEVLGQVLHYSSTT